MNKIKISAVSYTNTKPFIWGLEKSGMFDRADITLDNPSDCARKLIDNEVDIGLVPVAALLDIPNCTIISNYCIGADGPVNSVFIFSKKRISTIDTIRLDMQSRTSNALAKLLLKYHWKIQAKLVTDPDVETDAFVEIGDRTFGKKNSFEFWYDLAEEWKSFTGLPFAFAVWASNKPIPVDFVVTFNNALNLGLQNIELVLDELPKRSDFDLREYLTSQLDFILNDDKRKAIDLFLDYLGNDNSTRAYN